MAAAKSTTSKTKKTTARRTSEGRTTPSRSQKSGTVPAGVDVGRPLPRFSLANQKGAIVDNATLKGRSFVLYFYPKDDTPGCTREACGFRDVYSRLLRRGISVVGVSPDSTERHAKFADKYGLRFTLLSDDDRQFAKRCGVWVEKTLYGRTSFGIERSTFLVDGQGTIRRAWRRVKVDGHVDTVLQAIAELGLG